MGGSAFIGRIGGLAAALGIGAAVVYGCGVASADPSGQAGSDSSSANADTKSATPSAGTTSGPTSSAQDGSPTGQAGSPSSTVSTPSGTISSAEPGVVVGTGGSTTTSQQPVTSGTQTRTAETDFTSLDRTAPLRTGDRPKVFKPADTATRPPAESTTTTNVADTRTLSTPSPKVESNNTVITASVVPDTVPVTTLTVPSVAVVVSAPDVPAVIVPRQSAASQDPVDVTATAMANLANPMVGLLAVDGPTGPVESPAAWAMLAAARREAFMAPTVTALAPPATVLAIPQTAPFAVLQQLPLVGPIFVTPIVAFIHQIPVISDVLHPYIGFPLQLGLPPGTPVPRDVKVISFDGTQIYTHFMPAVGLAPGQTAPTILNGPGLGLPGNTNLDGALFDDIITDAVGQVSIATLRRAGYNVVTWDPRGEWSSGGQLEIDSPDFEGRDVSAIISWVSQQPEVQLDSPGDPRMGMVGVSYGGGIQLVTAAIDHRVDAIVPTIAWNSLNSSLYKNEAVKTSWGTILAGALIATGARVNPRIYPALAYGAVTGMVTPEDQQFLAERGPDYLLPNITAPTLLIQGTVDTLFTLAEADANAQALIAAGVPVKVLWFCGGHGICANNVFDLSDGALIEQRTLEWLDRYVKGDMSVSTGPQFEWVDQNGQWFSSTVYPVVQGPQLLASTGTAGTLSLVPVLGGSLPGFVFGTRAGNALNLTLPAQASTAHIVGAPQLTLTYSGTGISRHVYAQLVDDSTGLVLGSMVTPIPVTLDGQTRTVTIPLEPVAHTLAPGQTVTLQLVAWAGTYATPVTSGVLNVSSMQLALPTAANAVASSPSAAVLASVA